MIWIASGVSAGEAIGAPDEGAGAGGSTGPRFDSVSDSDLLGESAIPKLFDTEWGQRNERFGYQYSSTTMSPTVPSPPA